MRVAVLSVVPTLGKTTFCSILAGVFSRSQNREAAIFSTGSARDNIETVEVRVKQEELANAHTFKAMVDAAEKRDRELLHYGVRQGDDNVFIYNIMDSIMEEDDKFDLLKTAMGKIPTDLILVEIEGDPNSDFNKKVIAECDCSIILFTTSYKSMQKVKEIYGNLSLAEKKSCGFLCSMYNSTIISEKALSKQINIPMENIMYFPYSNLIQKMGIEQQVDYAAYKIAIGQEPALLIFRQRIQEVMQHLFDSPTRKIIRGLDKWYK